MATSGTWIEAQQARFAAAIAQMKDAKPDAWRLFDGDTDGRCALWAHLAADGPACLPIPMSVDVIDELAGPPGREAFDAGYAPDGVGLFAGRRS